jgi:GNAT superfamily N-acetyltransferase
VGTETSEGKSDQAIRPACADEAEALSELAIRSKGHWGYDAAFLEACRAELTLAADDLTDSPAFVCDGPNGPVGFYCLDVRDAGDCELDALFVDPDFIGLGVGKRLWEHAVGQAAALGCSEMTIQSDPFAERFYRAMGAERVGEMESLSVPGRMLPLLRYAIRRRRSD